MKQNHKCSTDLLVRSDFLLQLYQYCKQNIHTISWHRGIEPLYVATASLIIDTCGEWIGMYMLPPSLEDKYEMLYWAGVTLTQHEIDQVEDFVTNHVFPDAYEAFSMEMLDVMDLKKDRITYSYSNLLKYAYTVQRNYFRGHP